VDHAVVAVPWERVAAEDLIQDQRVVVHRHAY
jgi:hypothetical protein